MRDFSFLKDFSPHTHTHTHTQSKLQVRSECVHVQRPVNVFYR